MRVEDLLEEARKLNVADQVLLVKGLFGQGYTERTKQGEIIFFSGIKSDDKLNYRLMTKEEYKEADDELDL